MTDIKQAVERIVANDEKWDTFIAGDKDATFETDNGPRKSLEGELEEHIRIPNNNSEANMLAAQTAEAGAMAAVALADVSGLAAKADADRAIAERQTITDELAQVQALAAQVATDKDNVTATLIGDEDYVIPAVTALLDTYSDVVATAVSDDIWAEHSHKWGAPKRVLFLAKSESLHILDLTKPELPLWKLISQDGAGGARAGSIVGYQGGSGEITSICSAGSFAVFGRREATGEWSSGLILIDFAVDTAFRYRTFLSADKWMTGLSEASVDGGWGAVADQRIVNHWVNDVCAHIADDAPKHPISGLPIPHLAVATEGGVSELVPDNLGYWGVTSWTYSWGGIAWVAYTDYGRLLTGRGHNGLTWDLTGKPAGDIGSPIISDITDIRLKYLGGTALNGGRILARKGHSKGSILAHNPSDIDASMIAHFTDAHSTPFLAGDVQSAVMCDGEEGVVVGGELVSDGDFSGDLSAWVISGDGSAAIVSGDLELDAAVGSVELVRYIPVEIGQCYALPVGVISGVAGIKLGIDGGHSKYLAETPGGGEHEYIFTADDSMLRLQVYKSTGDASIDYLHFHAIAEDRSARNNHAIINGTLNRSKPVGSDVAVWSGFSLGLNNIEFTDSKYWFSHDLDWALTFATDSLKDFMISQIGPDAAWNTYDRTGFKAYVSGPGGSRTLSIKNFRGEDGFDEGRSVTVDWLENDLWKVVTIAKSGAGLSIFMQGELVALDANSWDIDAGVALDNLRLSAGLGNFALMNYTKTPPSPDQIRDMHRDMLNKLKKPSMLTGSVKALAHDVVRGDDWIACDDGQLHRLTQRGTTFEESIAVDPGVGDITSLGVNDGEITVGGSAGVWVKQPEKNLRAPVVKAGKSVQPFELGEGDSAQTDFYLSYGWKPVRAYIGGIKKRQGSQDDWTAQYDGYRWFIRFAVAPGSFDIDCDAVEV